MSILVYIESQENQIKKNSFELMSYAKELSKLISSELVAIVINCSNLSPLKNFSADKILTVSDDKLKLFNAHNYADLISNVAKNENSKNIILSDSVNSKYLAGLLSVKR